MHYTISIAQFICENPNLVRISGNKSSLIHVCWNFCSVVVVADYVKSVNISYKVFQRGLKA